MITGIKALWNIGTTSNIIKPKKIQVYESRIQIKQIIKQLSLHIDTQDTEENLKKKYINFWQRPQKHSLNMPIPQILRIQRQYKFIGFTKKQISELKQYDQKAQKIINNFFMFLLYGINIHKLSKLSYQQTKHWQTQLVEIITSINHFTYFMKKSKDFCLKYMSMMLFVNGKAKIYDHKEFSLHIKQILNHLILIPKSQFQPNQAIFLLNFISVFNINVWYYKKSEIILSTIVNFLPDNWEYHHSYRKKIMRKLYLLGIYSQNLNKKIWNIYNTCQQDQDTRIKALCYLIRVYQITPQNASNQNIKKIIKRFTMSVDKGQFFYRVVPEFYRAGIWIPQFWIPFFEYALQNFEKFTLYNLFVIMQLLKIEKQSISSQVLEMGKIYTQKLKKEYKDITVLDIQHEYQRQYASFHRNVNCQTQLANSLRLLNKGQVRTEVALGIFNVDILVNNKYVVEVNGGSHYIYNIQTQEKKLSLKSRFREDILPKLGYHIFNVNVMQFNEGSFELISKIYKQIEKIQDSQKKIKQ